MKKEVIKALKSYHRLNNKEKIEFQNSINRNKKMENLSARAALANQLMGSLSNADGTPYFNVDWVAKNIMKMSDEEIQNNKLLNNGGKK